MPKLERLKLYRVKSNAYRIWFKKNEKLLNRLNRTAYKDPESARYLKNLLRFGEKLKELEGKVLKCDMENESMVSLLYDRPIEREDGTKIVGIWLDRELVEFVGYSD